MIKMNVMKQKKTLRERGLLSQVYMLIIAGIIIIGLFTYVTQSLLARRTVRNQMTVSATEAVREVNASLQEYPAHGWLLSYWAAHASELDIEYDADFAGNTETEEKCEILAAHDPGLQLRYCDQTIVEALPPEDQKLYAEIVYTWLITRMNQIKQSFGCDYLFVIITDTDEGSNPYGTQVFLLSGADPGSVRGTDYEQVYTLGTTVPIDQKGTQDAMREAVKSASAPANRGKLTVVGEQFKHSGKYVDFYSALEEKDGKAVLVGVTIYQGNMLRQIRFTTLWHTLISMGYQILLLNLVMHRVFLYMLRPLKKVQHEIRVYTESKDSKMAETTLKEILSGRHSVAIRQNEIGQLTEDFIDLTKEIDDYTKRLETEVAARERIEYELETAAQIQAHMLPNPHPQFPDHPEFLLSASMTPAREVGGDFYDYFFVDDHHLFMVIADVSDKGIPAALFMAQAKSLIKSRAKTGDGPAQILSSVNNQLNENNEKGFFVTVWLAVVDLNTGEGIAANAGHEHPALCRNQKNYELIVYKHNMVLGTMENIPYRQHSFRLYPGDRLFVYTDGVPEASNAANEQFGTDRMLEVLNTKPDAEPQELLERMRDAIDQFTGEMPRFDDTTMMCLHYRGVPKE